MKLIRKSVFVLLVALFGFGLVACGGGTGDQPTKPAGDDTQPTTPAGDDTQPTTPAGDDTKPGENLGELKIWVGSESTTFYQEKMNAYVEEYNKTHSSPFPGTIAVKGVDTGSAAGTYLADTDAGADIFIVAHDNLGKLLAGEGFIDAVTNEDLMDQMENQNSSAFLNAVYLQAGDGSEAQYYAVPVISQALVLYYNKTAFAGKEEKLATWEGILEVAKANNSFATSFMGTDGYNFSTFLLAQPKSADAIEAFGKQGTLKIYKDTIQSACYNWGDDQVAIMKYAQRFICDPNGRNGLLATSDGFATELQNGSALTLVGGAWKKGDVISSLGKDNWGVVALPSFTLTEADAYGTATAGMEFYSGSFADCKCFVMKKNSVFKEYLQDILLYLSSDAIQEASFTTCDNLPASSTAKLSASDPLSLALAQAQVDSGLHGIAQPFGFKTKYNTYYYSSGAPDLYVAIVQNTDNAYNETKIVETLKVASYIWARGLNPDLTTEAGLAKWNTHISQTSEKGN